MQISDRIDSVKGIGEKTRALFEKLNVNTVGQLLTYYPRDWSTILHFISQGRAAIYSYRIFLFVPIRWWLDIMRWTPWLKR